MIFVCMLVQAWVDHPDVTPYKAVHDALASVTPDMCGSFIAGVKTLSDPSVSLYWR